MTHDGFVEATSNRRLGKRVFHSDLTKKKLIKVKKLLNKDAMDLDMNEAASKSSNPHPETVIGNLSKCGGLQLHSIGSDTMCTRGRSDMHMNDSTKKWEHGRNTTPLSRVELQPAASRESFVPGADNERLNDHEM